MTQRLTELNTYLSYEKINYENLRDELQDAQFAYQNLPQKSPKKANLSKRIKKLTKERDKQKKLVTDMENEIVTLKAEFSNL